MPESPDANALKRRGRRRLVGAIALVLLAVIVLPMVFDPAPRPPAPPVTVRIPGEDESGFAPKVTPRGEPDKALPLAPPVAPEKSVAAKPLPDKGPALPVEKSTAEKPYTKPAEKPAEKAAVAPAPAAAHAPDERKRAQAALADAGFVIALGAYADDRNVRALMAKLRSERIPAYTEAMDTSKGPRTRVRAGPFPTEEAAEKVRARLQRLGVQPGPVAARTE